MVWKATYSQTTLELIAVLASIMILERLLRKQGYLDRMLKALSGLFRDRRIVMAMIPAFIGLMPSAGGALFSAPLVEEAAGKSVPAEEKAFVNFYYRHIWEYFLPIYPGVLLASSITQIPLSKLIPALAPFGILIILIGLPFLFSIKPSEIPASSSSDKEERGKLIKDVIFSTLPVIGVVALVLASVNAILAVLLVVGFLVFKHRYTPGQLIAVVREAVVIKTLVIIWGIMLFKEVMTATGSINDLPVLIGQLPIPQIAVLGMVSFLIAYLTGQTGFYVGIAFPIVVGAAGGQVSLPLAVFVFVAGSAGTMLSPMHLCLSLTIDYFKTNLTKVWPKLIVLETILVGVALINYLIPR